MVSMMMEMNADALTEGKDLYGVRDDGNECGCINRRQAEIRVVLPLMGRDPGWEERLKEATR